MVAEAILTFKNEGKCSFWAFSIQNFACGACNGYVTVRKRSVFVFCSGGAGAPDPGGGGPLTEKSKTLRPGGVARAERAQGGQAVARAAHGQSQGSGWRVGTQRVMQ